MPRMLFNFSKTGYTLLPMTSQWRFDKHQFLLFRKLSLYYRSFKAIAGCPPCSSPSRTARQHTQRAVHGTGCGPAVQISSRKTSGLQICRI